MNTGYSVCGHGELKESLMLKKSDFLVICLFGLVTLGSFAVAEEGSESNPNDEVILRLLVGPSFYSGTSPVDAGEAYGADIQFGVSDNFGIGATFAYGTGSGRTSGSGTSTFVSQKATLFGINPYYGIKKSGVSASVGMIVGALIVSSDTATTVASVTTDTSSSSSRFALGLSAAIDIPIVGPLSLSVDPQFVQTVGGTGNGVGFLSIKGGLAFRL